MVVCRVHAQNKGLLGYLLQGNVKLLAAPSSDTESPRMQARAVLRLLIRSDDRSPMLLLEDMFFAARKTDPAADAQLTQNIAAQAQAISARLQVPLCSKADALPSPLTCNDACTVPITR